MLVSYSVAVFPMYGRRISEPPTFQEVTLRHIPGSDLCVTSPGTAPAWRHVFLNIDHLNQENGLDINNPPTQV